MIQMMYFVQFLNIILRFILYFHQENDNNDDINLSRKEVPAAVFGSAKEVLAASGNNKRVAGNNEKLGNNECIFLIIINKLVINIGALDRFKKRKTGA